MRREKGDVRSAPFRDLFVFLLLLIRFKSSAIEVQEYVTTTKSQSFISTLPSLSETVLDEFESVYRSGDNQILGNVRGSLFGVDIDKDILPLSSLGDAASFTNDVSEFTYGELARNSWFFLLQAVHAISGETFYDLGAGEGRGVALAWASGLKATGIELLEKRYLASCAAIEKLKNLSLSPPHAKSTMEMHLGNFLKLDWSDADVVFINSVMCSDETMTALSNRAKFLKNGTRIVSFKPFKGDDFATTGKISLEVSWSKTDAVVYHVQQKITASDFLNAAQESVPPARSCMLHSKIRNTRDQCSNQLQC